MTTNMTTTTTATTRDAAVSYDPGTRLGVNQAAQAAGVSRATIKRRLGDRAFPNATQLGRQNAWSIPVQDLVDAALLPADRVASALEAVEESRDSRHIADLVDQVAELRNAAAIRDTELAGVRQQLEDARDQIAFLRSMTTVSRAA